MKEQANQLCKLLKKILRKKLLLLKSTNNRLFIFKNFNRIYFKIKNTKIKIQYGIYYINIISIENNNKDYPFYYLLKEYIFENIKSEEDYSNLMIELQKLIIELI